MANSPGREVEQTLSQNSLPQNLPSPMIKTPEAWLAAKPYQVEDAEFAVRHGRVVLGHKTGLGKTFISMLAWSKWPNARKTLIVGTLSSTSVWWRLLQKWAGITPTFIQGNDPQWDSVLKAKEGVYVTTYSTLRLLLSKERGQGRGQGSQPRKVNFDLLINDELHRAMRSRGTQIYTAMKRVGFENYLGLSATWSSRGPQDLWPVLHLMSPRTFPSYWAFVKTWCFVDKGPFGLEVYGVRNAENLRSMLRGKYFRSRTWGEVGNQFREGYEGEPVVRQVVKIPMSQTQGALYKALSHNMMVELASREEGEEGDGHIERVVTPTALSLLTRLLQMAISPQLLFQGQKVERGMAIEYLVDRIIETPHVVVFCPFRAGLEVLGKALQGEKEFSKTVYMLHGQLNLSPEKINEVVSTWKRSRGVMLCTTSFAQSFDLDTTDTAYMLGYSWDPNDNIQAEGRLRRLDSILQTPCLVRYIVVEGTAYEDVAEVVNGKYTTVVEFLRGYGLAHQKASETVPLKGPSFAS